MWVCSCGGAAKLLSAAVVFSLSRLGSFSASLYLMACAGTDTWDANYAATQTPKLSLPEMKNTAYLRVRNIPDFSRSALINRAPICHSLEHPRQRFFAQKLSGLASTSADIFYATRTLSLTNLLDRAVWTRASSAHSGGGVVRPSCRKKASSHSTHALSADVSFFIFENFDSTSSF